MSYKKLLEQQIILLQNLSSQISKLIEYNPNFRSLSDIANELNLSNQTIRYHLTTNYEPEIDFLKKNGKILINSKVVLKIRDYYEKK